MTKLLRCLFLTVLLAGSFSQGKAQTTPPATPASLIERIKQLQATVENRRAYLTELQPGGNYLLPIGLLKQGDGGNKPAILIDEIELHSTYAQLKAYVAFNLPGNDDPIYFATVEPVRIGYSGGILGQAKLSLVEDRVIKMGSDDTKLTILGQRPGHEGSYVSFDCKGFSGARLEVEGALSSKLVKENADGTQNLNDRVKASFTLEFSDLNDILASASIEPFQIRGVPRLSFEVQQAVVDLSDYKNEANMVFPTGYLDDYYPGTGLDKLWRGFYLKSLKVKLPQEIEDRSNNGARKEISLTNMLIDNHGFSGEITALNLITLENGNMDGWSYSIDKIALGFKANQFISGSLGGGINIPITKDDGSQSLSYNASIDQSMQYVFNVTLKNNLDFTLFKASNVTLYDGSTINATNVGGKFKAQANLHGAMSISASLNNDPSENSDEKKFNLANIAFQNLQVSTSAPYLSVGSFSFAAAIKMGAFSATLSKISLVTEGETRKLNFDMSLNLLNLAHATNSFAADASLSINSKLSLALNGSQKYAYSGISISRIYIDADQGAFSLKGGVNFFTDDPSFGTGFRGDLAVKLPMKIGLTATALFGSVNLQGQQHKYWYVDALTNFPSGAIQVFPTIEVNGFAGGLYYGLKQKPSTGGNIGVGNPSTGLVYQPDLSAGLGIKASVMFGLLKNPNAFNGSIGFEVAFNSGGGINSVMLMGNANLMQQFPSDFLSKIKDKCADVAGSGTLNEDAYKAMPPGNGVFAVNVLMIYSENDGGFLKVSISSKIDAAIIQATAAGEAYFSNSKWHINIGEMYGKRIEVVLLNAIKANAYFMMGTDVPTELPLIDHLERRSRDLTVSNSIATGAGFAFGASVSFNIPETRFLIFYGKLDAGAGFDIIISKTNTLCEGTGLIGINGWYASGQIYAYIDFEIGLTAKLFGRRRKFEIAAAQLAAIFKAKLPNPLWMKGIVKGQYRVMGGLIKGKFSFEFTLGELCKAINPGELAEDIKVISEVTPKNNTQEVSVFSSPQVLFNIPIGNSFYMQDTNGDDIGFRAKNPLIQVWANGILIEGSSKWNADKTVLAFTPKKVLPEKTDVTVNVKIEFEELNSGLWQDYYVNGQRFTEQASVVFKTGVRPWSIPSSNVAYSYPIADQKNFYKNEYKDYDQPGRGKGYVMLIQGQDYLFAHPSLKQVAVLKSENGTDIGAYDIYYHDNTLEFNFPDLQNNTNYSLAFRTEKKFPEDDKIDINVITKTTNLLTTITEEGDEVDAFVDTKDANSSIENKDNETEKVIYSLKFRSSKYNTLEDKLNSSSKATNFINDYESVLSVTTDEPFDIIELPGTAQSQLIRIAPDFNGFRNTNGGRSIYDSYPIDPSLTFSDRINPNSFEIDLGYENGGNQINIHCDPKIFQHDYESLSPLFQLFYYQNAGLNSNRYPFDIYSIGSNYYGVSPDDGSYPNGFPYFGYDTYGNYHSLRQENLSYQNCLYNQLYGPWRPSCYRSPYYLDGYDSFYYRHMLYYRKHISSESYFQSDLYELLVEPTYEMEQKLDKILPYMHQDFNNLFYIPIGQPFQIVLEHKLPGKNTITSTSYLNVNVNY